jgi:hypothetical protein
MSFVCPTCGAAIPGKHLGAALVVCAYCRTTSAVAAGGLSAEGVGAALADVESAFAVGRSGRFAASLGGGAFEVTGWARYLNDTGVWEEWLLLFLDGTRQLVLEEEGTFALYSGPQQSEPLALAEERPGNYLKLGDHRVLIRAKGRAQFQGGRGGVAAPFSPSETFDFVEGTVKHQLARVSSGPRKSVFMLGRPIERADFEVDAEVEAEVRLDPEER